MRKIAVLRANALGDFIFVLPALQALRERFPDAEIVYLGKKMHEVFLTGRPGPVDRVIVVPPYPGVGETEDYEPDLIAVQDFFKRMQEEQFDIAIQLHGGGHFSNPFLLQLGAKLNIGLQAPDAAPLDISIPYVRYYSEVLRYLEVVSYLGATTRQPAPHVQVMDKDRAEAQQVIRDAHQPIAVLHPGATDPRRRWPAVHFARIADYLVKAGYAVYINGVQEEAHLCDAILQHMREKHGAYSISGELSICGLTGLLSMADIVVANDSGPLHLAHALKVPAVGIYWVGNMITGTPMGVSINRPLISWTMECPLCGMNIHELQHRHSDCKHYASFVASVCVEEVQQAVQELIHLNNCQLKNNDPAVIKENAIFN